MIRLRGVSHSFLNGTEVLSGADVVIPTDQRVALLGPKSSGKSTVLSLLAGISTPKAGKIDRFEQLSFPAGFQGGFRLTHTGRQNIMFAARAYGADPHEVFEFVRHITGFGDTLDLPMRQLSLHNRVSLSYVLTYALPFDCYLFDNIIGPVGSEIPDFLNICQEMYARRTAERGAIVATRNSYIAEKYCDCAIVLRDRKLEFYDDVRQGIIVYEQDCLAAEEVPSAGYASYQSPVDEGEDELVEF